MIGVGTGLDPRLLSTCRRYRRRRRRRRSVYRRLANGMVGAGDNTQQTGMSE